MESTWLILKMREGPGATSIHQESDVHAILAHPNSFVPSQGTDELGNSLWLPCERGSDVPALGKEQALLRVGGLSLGPSLKCPSQFILSYLEPCHCHSLSWEREEPILSNSPCPGPWPSLQAPLGQL